MTAYKERALPLCLKVPAWDAAALSSLCEAGMCCSFSITQSVVEAREPGSWSGQKPQKVYFQNIRGVEMLTGVRLSWLQEMLCLPAQIQAAKSQGASMCVCVHGWAEGLVTRSWLARAKSNHFQHSHIVCLHAPACWTAVVWQVLEEGFHRARLPLISHLCCQGSG